MDILEEMKLSSFISPFLKLHHLTTKNGYAIMRKIEELKN
jgi:hypothetical protein